MTYFLTQKRNSYLYSIKMLCISIFAWNDTQQWVAGFSEGSHVTTFAENNDVAKSQRETNAALSLSFSNDLLNMVEYA